jgi:acetate kinase
VRVLVLNCGSSSVKYQLVETSRARIARNDDLVLARGAVERIGSGSAVHAYQRDGEPRTTEAKEILEHRGAVADILRLLTDPERGVVGDPAEIAAVGHRVVHGGERFSASVRIDAEVERGIEQCCELAPLHNPHNLRGLRAARAVLGSVPHVAVFDTAFHHSLPPHAYLYGLPYALYTRHAIRRYGFHGTSHRYVAWRSEALLGRPRAETRLVTCHLGAGASVCAIDRGRSIDTSMGFTPLEGLLMGTRAGDLDASLVFHILHAEDLDEHQLTAMLNKHSGLYGLSGISGDMREILAEEAKGHERARLAIDAFCYRLRKYIGAYVAALGGLDALIFTGGIGENAPAIRARTLAGLGVLGLEIDAGANDAAIGREARISTATSRAAVLVIPTNEELLIARDTVRLVDGDRA